VCSALRILKIIFARRHRGPLIQFGHYLDLVDYLLGSTKSYLGIFSAY
jgi:hypothetical protein